MAMEPEARIAPPEGNGEPLENMSGGRDRVHGAGLVGNCPAQGADENFFLIIIRMPTVN